MLPFNAVMAKEGMDISDLGGNASDDEVTVNMQETEGDLSRDEITQEIESMSVLRSPVVNRTGYGKGGVGARA